MAEQVEKSEANGGWVRRSAKTGQFVSVETVKGTSKKSPKTDATVKEVSSRRQAALKRLADR
ncbi:MULTISPECIES: hypothetical protein [unclassified Marinovum]